MAKEETFRANAPFAAVLFLFLGTFHPPCPTDGRPDTSRGRHATAGTRRANCTQIHAFRPRRRLCSNPHRPGLDLHRLGLDLHQSGKICIDRVPSTQAQPRSTCLLISTRKPAASAGPVDAARAPRRCPGPSTLPGPFDPVPALRGRATTSDRRRRITSGSPRPPKRRWERRRAE